MRLWPQQEGQTLTELQVHHTANSRRTKLCGSCCARSRGCCAALLSFSLRVQSRRTRKPEQFQNWFRGSERHPPPCVTKGDQIKGSLDSLKAMDKALMDNYRRSLSQHTKCRPSLALSATALGIFQLQVRTGQGQRAWLSIGRNGGP